MAHDCYRISCHAVKNPLATSRGQGLQLDIEPTDPWYYQDDVDHNRLFFMRRYTIETDSESEDDGPLDQCILLRLTDPQKVLYERIGTAGVWLAAAPRPIEAADSHFPCLRLLYGLHTVRII